MLPKKILIAHDFSKAADKATQFASELAKQVGARLDVVYVFPDLYDGRGDDILALPPTTPGEAERYLEFLRQELTRSVQETLGEAAAGVNTHVLRGDPVKRIEAATRELEADTLCVGATGKGGIARMLLGSTSLSLMRSSSVPVLVVP